MSERSESDRVAVFQRWESQFEKLVQREDSPISNPKASQDLVHLLRLIATAPNIETVHQRIGDLITAHTANSYGGFIYRHESPGQSTASYYALHMLQDPQSPAISILESDESKANFGSLAQGDYRVVSAPVAIAGTTPILTYAGSQS